MKKKYTPEIERYIRKHSEEMTGPEMVEKLKEKFGLDVNRKALSSYYKVHHFHTCPRTGRKSPWARITTPEMDKFILKHYKGTGHRAMAEMVNAKFGTNFTAEQIKGYYHRNKLDSGLTGYFPKGQPSWTKGLTWDDFMPKESQEHSRRTQYKKGHIPHNGGAPIGELRERTDKTGRVYVYVKTAQPGTWRPKHVVEWEKHHGPVPAGYVVSFCDGNSRNWNINNLIISTRAEHAIKNHLNVHGYDRQSEAVANRIADIKLAINKKKRRKK